MDSFVILIDTLLHSFFAIYQINFCFCCCETSFSVHVDLKLKAFTRKDELCFYSKQWSNFIDYTKVESLQPEIVSPHSKHCHEFLVSIFMNLMKEHNICWHILTNLSILVIERSPQPSLNHFSKTVWRKTKLKRDKHDFFARLVFILEKLFISFLIGCHHSQCCQFNWEIFCMNLLFNSNVPVSWYIAYFIFPASTYILKYQSFFFSLDTLLNSFLQYDKSLLAFVDLKFKAITLEAKLLSIKLMRNI